MSEEDEERVTFDRPIKDCYNCAHFKTRLFHPKIPETSDKISWLLALENVQKLYCAKDRIVYKDGSPKSYKSPQYLKTPSEKEGDCPDFEDMRPEEERNED